MQTMHNQHNSHTFIFCTLRNSCYSVNCKSYHLNLLLVTCILKNNNLFVVL